MFTLTAMVPGPAAGATGSTGTSGQEVTISIDCAPPAAQQPVQHKERLEDLAIFEKANAQHHH